MSEAKGMPSMGENMRDQVLDLLARVPVVSLIVRPRDGATLPARFMDKDHIVLELGYNMPSPIPDLSVSTIGIACTLSFAGEPSVVLLPWSCVLGWGQPEHGAQVEGVPEVKVRQDPAGSEPTRPVGKGQGKASGLRLIKGGG